MSEPNWFEQLYANPDFHLNLLAEAHGVIVEAILITIIAAFVLRAWENRKWRPARVNVARNICLVHKALFNSSRHVMDPHFEIDKGAHGFPAHVTQEEAVFWGKSQFLPHLEPALNRLKKTIEYNNVALDSTLMPLASDFLLSSEELLNCIRFLIEAYNPKTRNPLATLFPKESILKMHSVYTAIAKMYPEATAVEPSGPRLFSGQELSDLFEQAESKNKRIQLLRKPKDA